MNRSRPIQEALRGDKRWLASWVALLLIVTSIPYVYAWARTPAGMRFGGMIANPLDGNTYLAKMAQGAAGEWRFRLPYTSEPHEGAPIYMYYLFLGHLARLTGLSLPLVYHVARMLNGILLWLTGYVFFAAIFTDRGTRRLAWLLTFLASGLGWLTSILGHLTPDLLVPEMIPFYTAYVNPHFPLALASMLALLMIILVPLNAPRETPVDILRLAGAIGSSSLIALTQPFLFLPIGIVSLVVLTSRWKRWAQVPTNGIVYGVAAACVAAPLCAVQLLAFTSNEAIRAHAAQDITLSPPPWDYTLGFAALCPLALLGLVQALRRRSSVDLFLLVWITAGVGLVYLPVNFQRRLSMGLQVPLAALAAIGLTIGLPRHWPDVTTRRLTHAVTAFAFLSNLFLLLLGIGAAARVDPLLYLLPGEPQALEWLSRQPRAGAVLASPRTAMFIPAWANQPSYYGHPMETLNAASKKVEVEAFFTGTMIPAAQRALLSRADLSWLWIGPYERASATMAWSQSLAGLPIVYDRSGVTIYDLSGG